VPILNAEGESILVPILVGGVSRSGKSGLAWALLAGFIEAGIPVRVRVLDLGGGTEFAALRHAFDNELHTDRFRVHSYTSKPADAEKVIKDAVDAMNARCTRWASGGSGYTNRPLTNRTTSCCATKCCGCGPSSRKPTTAPWVTC
jgi:hypothetical protein